MSHDRDRQAIASLDCPSCPAVKGRACRMAGTRPIACAARRRAWQQTRPTLPIEGADILIADGATGEPGHRHTFMVLAPISAKGRAAIGGTRTVEHDEARVTLARLRRRGLIVMREQR